MDRDRRVTITAVGIRDPRGDTRTGECRSGCVRRRSRIRRGAPLADGSATARHPTADVACVRPGPRTCRVVRWPVGPQGRRAGDSHVLMLFVPCGHRRTAAPGPCRPSPRARRRAWPIAIPHRVPAVCGTSRGNGFINGFATIARHRTSRRTVPAAGGLSTPPTRKTPCACDVALTLILVTACVNATFSAPPRVAGARRQTRVGPW